MWGWTVVGLILEVWGFWLLFCEFIPTALQFFRRMPLMNKILDLPVIKMVGGFHVLGGACGRGIGAGWISWCLMHGNRYLQAAFGPRCACA